MYRVVWAGLACLALGSLFALLSRSSAARAEEKRPQGAVTVYTSPADEDPKLKGRPVMVSFIARGAVVQQGEIELGSLKIFEKLPAGPYEVRAEGDGLVSLVKRGVAVTDRGDTDLRFPMRAGKGVRVIEYGVRKAPWEELDARLKRLERAVEELKKRK